MGLTLVAQTAIGLVFGLGVWWGRAGSASEATTSPPSSVSSAESEELASDGSRESDPLAVLVDAEITPAGELVVVVDYRNFRSGAHIADREHAHVYPASYDVDQIGTPGEHSIGGGFWHVVDQERTTIRAEVAQYFIEAGGVCVATATADHTLVHLETNCIDL